MDSQEDGSMLGRLKRVSWLVSCLCPGVNGSGRVLLKSLTANVLGLWEGGLLGCKYAGARI